MGNNWGGKRKGAGRKPVIPPRYTLPVRLTEKQITLLMRWGGGDVSAGLRWLIDAAEPFIQANDPTTSVRR